MNPAVLALAADLVPRIWDAADAWRRHRRERKQETAEIAAEVAELYGRSRDYLGDDVRDLLESVALGARTMDQIALPLRARVGLVVRSYGELRHRLDDKAQRSLIITATIAVALQEEAGRRWASDKRLRREVERMIAEWRETRAVLEQAEARRVVTAPPAPASVDHEADEEPQKETTTMGETQTGSGGFDWSILGDKAFGLLWTIWGDNAVEAARKVRDAEIPLLDGEGKAAAWARALADLNRDGKLTLADVPDRWLNRLRELAVAKLEAIDGLPEGLAEAAGAIIAALEGGDPA